MFKTTGLDQNLVDIAFETGGCGMQDSRDFSKQEKRYRKIG
jgi:hypothetical protein